MRTITIDEALKLNNTVFVDVRTESEYNEDHIMDAYNLPIFSDDEHRDVGTIYKMQGKHEAIQQGFDYVKDKLKGLYNDVHLKSNEYENVVLYCARGGMRSGSLANIIETLGVKNVYKLEGGYKAYRNYVIDYLSKIMDKKEFIVLHGLTGVGKTDMLLMLEKNGIDIIDLEGLAKNSGSTFGFITFDEKPPSQKRFESEIFRKIYYSKSDYIFIESESRRVGSLNVPNDIYNAIIREGKHILMECSVKSRVDRLCRDYIYRDESKKDALIECMNKFRKRLGHSAVDNYIKLFEEGKYEELIELYLVEYYDKLYNHSVEKYEYNMILDCDDMENALSILKEFHKDAVEGRI